MAPAGDLVSLVLVASALGKHLNEDPMSSTPKRETNRNLNRLNSREAVITHREN